MRDNIWVPVPNTPIIDTATMHNKILCYSPGGATNDLRSKSLVSQRQKGPLNILVFQSLGIITSIMTAVEETCAVQWWREPYQDDAQTTNKDILNKTLHNKTSKITNRICLIDMPNFCSLSPSTTASTLNHYSTTFSVAMLVISAGEKNLEPYKNFLVTLQEASIPHVVVISFTDRTQPPDHVINTLKLDENKVVRIAPYSKNNTRFNDKTNKQALNLLLYTIQEAEAFLSRTNFNSPTVPSPPIYRNQTIILVVCVILFMQGFTLPQR